MSDFDKKDKLKAYQKAWHQANRRERSLKMSAWRKENKERELAQQKIYRKNNVKKIKEYREANKDKQKVRIKAWRINNREKHLKQMKSWREDNRDKHNALNAKRRALKMQATPKWMTKDDFAAIEEWYQIAKDLQWLSEEKLHVDHIIPLQGEDVSGLHIAANLQILPASINIAKGNKLNV